MRHHTAALIGCFLLMASPTRAAESRDAKVRQDRQDVQATELWIYNDLAQGFAQAKKTGKPLLVVFR